MMPKFYSLCRAALLGIPLLTFVGCGDEDAFSPEFEQPPLTFEQFLERTPYDEQDDSYMVEGDIGIYGREALEDYFYSHSRVSDDALTLNLRVNMINGATTRDVVPAEDRTRLTYCIQTPFISVDDAGRAVDRTDEIGDFFLEATGDWEAAANIDFVRIFDQPCQHRGNPSATRYTNLIVVPFNFSRDNTEPRDDGALAQAFYPSTVSWKRKIKVDPVLFSTSDYSPAGIIRHELGHVLGFRHENAARPDAPRQCETQGAIEMLTPYDALSVMTTPACEGFTSDQLTLTSRDRSGARAVYGAPVSPLRTRRAQSLVRDLYHVTLRRTPDSAGFDFWTSIARRNRSSCDSTVRDFFSSSTFESNPLDDDEFLDALYFVVLNRSPDTAGRNFWLNALRRGVSRDTAINNFIASERGTSRCGIIH